MKLATLASVPPHKVSTSISGDGDGGGDDDGGCDAAGMPACQRGLGRLGIP